MKTRFDGFLPVVIDVETSGCIASSDGLLELAAVSVEFDAEEELQMGRSYACHIEPFSGARIDPKSLEINGIDPTHPFRFAISETQALLELFSFVYGLLKKSGCRRALLTGHNAHFDLSFLQAAIERCGLRKKSPFHSFSCFDTATLSGFMYRRTVLAKALGAAKIPFDPNQAHSAIYDAQQTATLFCLMVNRLHRLRSQANPSASVPLSKLWPSK